MEHLALARSLIGTIKDGPQVPELAREIGRAFPDQAAYCSTATASTSWCGIFIAVVLLRAYHVRPPYNKNNELLSFMWADSFEDAGWGTPVPVGQEQPGDVLIFRVPHHVTFLAGVEDERYRCIGGNQHDGVTETTFAKSGLRAIRRPPTTGQAVVVPVQSSGHIFTDIKATVFNDVELAYGPKPPDFMGYSLPGRISGELPLRITNRATGLSAVGNKCDIGPWYASGVRGGEDRWWENGTRPRAETDSQTNGAGIDLYPALARAIGVPIVERGGRIVAGEAQVDVEIISENQMAEPSDAKLNQINSRIDELAQIVNALARVVNFGKEVVDQTKLGNQPKPADPVLPVSPDIPAVRRPTDPLAPANFGTLMTSLAAMIALPANNITGTIDTGTIGSLLPLAGAVASAFGVPGWILPIVGKLISGIGSSK